MHNANYDSAEVWGDTAHGYEAVIRGCVRGAAAGLALRHGGQELAAVPVRPLS